MATVLKLQERIEAEHLSANFRLKSGLDTFTLSYRILLKFYVLPIQIYRSGWFQSPTMVFAAFGYEIVSFF